jgi:hypothetical protein
MMDRAQARPEIKNICVVKVDHIGDFVTALPALQALKNEFPAAVIDMVCGRWNVAMARASGLFREVYPCEFFAENPGKGLKGPTGGFPPEVIGQKYDLAIDLRVHEETRVLLPNISARWYAGIGEAVSNATNVIVLPRQSTGAVAPDAGPQGFAPALLKFLPAEIGSLRQSYSLVDENTVVRFTAYKKHENLIVAGPLPLAAGIYRASFLCSFWQKIFTRRPIVMLGAFRNGRCIIERRCALKRTHDPVSFEFFVERDNEPIDLRLRIRRGRFTRIDFRGVLIHRINRHRGRVAEELNSAPEELNSAPEERSARLRLHISEQLLLLVNLVACRLNGASFPDFLHSASGDDHPLNIVIAPFSNSIIRDWPTEHYEELARRLYAYYRCKIVLIGSASQAEALDSLMVRLQSAGVGRVVVEAGKPLLEAMSRLSQASIVVSNNSGMAHLAGALGRPVVAIYSASHNVDEWGTVGTNVWQLQAEIACQDCCLDFVDSCHNDHRCMRDLPPDVVFDVIKEQVSWGGNNQPPPTVSPGGSGSVSKLGSLPKSQADVSILIAAYNRIELTRACLDSIFAEADPGMTVEVIVTDDCSSDGTDAFLKSLGQEVRVISNGVRRSFGENMNRAAYEARGEYLCLLNNDAVVTPGWLARLLDAARKDPAVGVLGNLHITPATGKIDHAGMVFDREYNALHLYRGMDSSYRPAHLTREFQMVTGACWLVPRTLFLRMDGFDPIFKNGCEDTDFCLRLPLLDRKVLYVGDSVIYHHGASSPGRMDHEEANLNYFYSKWRGRIRPDLDDYLRRDVGPNDQGAEKWRRDLNPAPAA